LLLVRRDFKSSARLEVSDDSSGLELLGRDGSPSEMSEDRDISGTAFTMTPRDTDDPSTAIVIDNRDRPFPTDARAMMRRSQ